MGPWLVEVKTPEELEPWLDGGPPDRPDSTVMLVRGDGPAIRAFLPNALDAAKVDSGRVVVFYASTGQLKTGFFGVLTQGFPQLVRVNRDVLKLEAKDGWPAGAPVLCRVRMINEFPMIPNLEAIETMLATEALQA